MTTLSDPDLWGLRQPTAPPQRRAPRTEEESQRLVGLLQTEPTVAGRLHDVHLADIGRSWSGATMVYGTWEGDLPVIAKLDAGAREVNWATRLSQHTPDLVPHVYASAYTLCAEPFPWMLMERCPYRLDYKWGHHLYTMVIDAGVRFHLAARQIAPPVGPTHVWLDWFCSLVRLALTSDPPVPGPAAEVIARLEDDWRWVLRVCKVEFAHGDLHLANAVWRHAPPHPDAKALLVDYACHPLPWVSEPAYCQVIYWPGGTGHPDHPTLVHEMAALRTAHGLEVPSPADVDRLATLFLAWQFLRAWPRVTHRHNLPDYVTSVTQAVEAAAAV